MRQSLETDAGKDLYVSLYASFCHSPVAIISLCLLAQVCVAFGLDVMAIHFPNSSFFILPFWIVFLLIKHFDCCFGQTYHHACAVIHSLVEEDINVKFLVQLDKLVRLLETPIFAYLRLQVYNLIHNSMFPFTEICKNLLLVSISIDYAGSPPLTSSWPLSP